MSPSEEGGRRRVRSEEGEMERKVFGTASKVMESRDINGAEVGMGPACCLEESGY